MPECEVVLECEVLLECGVLLGCGGVLESGVMSVCIDMAKTSAHLCFRV